MLESHFSQYHFKWAPLRGLRTDKWKYILAPKPELYDLEEDPGELYNIASRRPAAAAEMDRRLTELARSVSSPEVDRSASTSIDPETRAKLEALGYLSGGGAADRLKDFPSRDELAEMPNPLDGAIALHYVNACSEMLRAQNFVDALGVARRGIGADPDNYRLQYLLGQAQLGLGNPDKAIAEFDRAVQINPSDAATHSVIGRIHYMLGRFEEARIALERAIELEPNRADAVETLGMAYARLGDLDRAMERLQLAIDLDDGSWRAVLRLGRIQADSGRLEEARASFQRAMTLNPYSSEVLGTIGVFYLQIGNPEFGRTSLEQAHRIAPDDPAISLYLAEALLQTNADQAFVRDQLERVVTLAPESKLAAKARRILAEMSSDQL
ncbi:MAG: tetratricopeptide repeat protein, partial [Thermoanaerobaculales bacterium]|nr:tetratricopeptide repeat protein [Thermoanaerobaculales bacterium]